MKKKVLRKYYWIIGLVIIIILTLCFFYITPEGETISLHLKSCSELSKLKSDKIDFSCRTDEDCIYTDVLICGGCVNKNSDIEGYLLIERVSIAKGCPFAADFCVSTIIGCKCLNNTCESIPGT